MTFLFNLIFFSCWFLDYGYGLQPDDKRFDFSQKIPFASCPEDITGKTVGALNEMRKIYNSPQLAQDLKMTAIAQRLTNALVPSDPLKEMDEALQRACPLQYSCVVFNAIIFDKENLEGNLFNLIFPESYLKDSSVYFSEGESADSLDASSYIGKLAASIWSSSRRVGVGCCAGSECNLGVKTSENTFVIVLTFEPKALVKGHFGENIHQPVSQIKFEYKQECGAFADALLIRLNEDRQSRIRAPRLYLSPEISREAQLWVNTHHEAPTLGTSRHYAELYWSGKLEENSLLIWPHSPVSSWNGQRPRFKGDLIEELEWHGVKAAGVGCELEKDNMLQVLVYFERSLEAGNSKRALSPPAIRSSESRFQCPPTYTGLFPHPDYCEQYLDCSLSPGYIIEQTCPPGDVFDSETRACMSAQKANCFPGSADPTERFITCPKELNDLFPNPHDCTRYYICSGGGQALAAKCPTGKKFDYEVKKCLNGKSGVKCFTADSNKQDQNQEDPKDSQEPTEPEIPMPKHDPNTIPDSSESPPNVTFNFHVNLNLDEDDKEDGAKLGKIALDTIKPSTKIPKTKNGTTGPVDLNINIENPEQFQQILNSTEGAKQLLQAIDAAIPIGSQSDSPQQRKELIELISSEVKRKLATAADQLESKLLGASNTFSTSKVKTKNQNRVQFVLKIDNPKQAQSLFGS